MTLHTGSLVEHRLTEAKKTSEPTVGNARKFTNLGLTVLELYVQYKNTVLPVKYPSILCQWFAIKDGQENTYDGTRRRECLWLYAFVRFPAGFHGILFFKDDTTIHIYIHRANCFLRERQPKRKHTISGIDFPE